MSPTVFPLGFTNIYYFYSMVMKQEKIITATRQITTTTTKNPINVFTTNTTDNNTTDASEVWSNNENAGLGLIIAFMIAFLSEVFVWCFEKIRVSMRRSGEMAPLLSHKTTVSDQPPSYAELSPSYPSPPEYGDLNLGSGQEVGLHRYLVFALESSFCDI